MRILSFIAEISILLTISCNNSQDSDSQKNSSAVNSSNDEERIDTTDFVTDSIVSEYDLLDSLVVEWDESVGYWDRPVELIETNDNDFIILYSFSDGQNAGFSVRKRLKNGNSVWDYEFGDYEETNDPYAILKTKDEGFVIVSFTLQSGLYKIRKLNKEGKEQWNKIYDKNEYFFVDFVLTEKDNLVILNNITTENKQFELIEFDERFEILNKQEVVFDKELTDYDFICIKNRNYVFIDRINRCLMEVDKLGNVKIISVFEEMEKLVSVIQTTDNGYIVLGIMREDTELSERKMYVIKIDNQRKVLWHNTFVYKKEYSIVDLIENTDKSISVATVMYDNSCQLLKYDKTGERLFKKSTKQFEDFSMSCILSTLDDGLLISGETFSQESGRYVVRTVKVK